ncbi:MAG: lamin tail domain-containing protein, partial [Chitinophagales bacterium]
QVDAYRDKFSYYINYISTYAMQPDVIIPHIDSIRELIAPAAFEDLFRSFDYGYTYDDFYNGFDMNDIDDHTPYGIENFIIARTDNTLAQVELNAIPPIIKYPTHTPGLLQENSNAQFNVMVEDDASINAVTFSYSNDNIAFMEIPMYDDGTHQDGAANDGNYGIDIEILIGETDFYYFITATDVDGLSSNYPACASLYLPIGFTAPNLVINEFMAVNTATLADEVGVYSDYIELFNRGNTDIYLGDKFLSDEWDRPGKWRLPNFNLFAGEYLIIYADDNPEAGNYHCGFKLDGDKDEIGLFAGPEYAYAIIDSISFVNQKADTATGRIPNGTGPFIELLEPSPGQNNEIIVPPVDSAYTESVLILGNPASDATIVVLGLTSLTAVQFDMVDLNGQVIFRISEGIMGSGSYIYPLNIEGIASGIYFFRLIADDKVSTYKFVIY